MEPSAIRMTWQPKRSSSDPLKDQIQDHIRSQVAQGHWTVGMKLPSQRELARLWSVNRSTVVEALEDLKAEGILESVPGSGIRVANDTWALFAGGARTNWSRYIDEGLHVPNQPTIQAINRHEFQPGIIRLGTGELSPELYPGEALRTVLTRAGDRIPELGYLEGKGLPELRRAICDRVRPLGIEAQPEQVIITTGALQALQLIALGVTPARSSVLVEQPSYLQSLHVFQSAGMQLKTVDTDPYGIRLRALEQAARGQEARFLYTIPTFHNPSGVLMPLERRQALLDLCRRERLPIIEDDAYRELWLDQPPPPPIRALDERGGVLYLGTVSKCLAPGIRTGWVIGPESVIDRLADIKMQTDYGSSSLSQWALAEWMESGLYDLQAEQVRRALRERRAIALQLLERLMGTSATWAPPQGGFYIWVRLNRPMAMHRLFSRALERGVLLNPGYLYAPGDDRHLRISYAYATPEALEAGLKVLAELVAGP